MKAFALSPHAQDLEVILQLMLNYVAGNEAREVLFGRLGAIKVATSVAVDNNNCEKSPTAVGRSTARGSAFGSQHYSHAL